MRTTVFLCLLLANLVSTWLPAQISTPAASSVSLLEDATRVRGDIWNAGISLGTRLLGSNIVEFKNTLLPPPTDVLQSMDDEGFAAVEIFLQYSIERYGIPGLALGLKVDYTFVNLKNLKLEIWRASNLAFQYSGGFVAVDSIGIVPLVEVRLLSLLEYLFTTDLPPWWDIYFPGVEVYFYGGPRFNYNIYNKSDLEIDGMDTFHVGYEFGGGVEVFVAQNISLRVGYALYTNNTEFKVKQGATEVLSGELNLQASRIALCLMYYF